MKIFVLAAYVLTMSFTSDAMANEPSTKVLHTPDGAITTTTTTVEPVPQEIRHASAKEIQGFNANEQQALVFTSAYLPVTQKKSLKDLDQAFSLWQKENKKRFTEQQVTDILGAYLGNKMARELQMEWVVVTDQYGTDYAVRALKYEVMSFPFSSVMKRVEDNENDFMVGVYYATAASLNSKESRPR